MSLVTTRWSRRVAAVLIAAFALVAVPASHHEADAISVCGYVSVGAITVPVVTGCTPPCPFLGVEQPQPPVKAFVCVR